jgi:predicted metal-dependent HD superfamily phosphohydrolase
MDNETLKERFTNIVLGIRSEPMIASKWSEALISRYTEPHRYYHTTSHIVAMIFCLIQYHVHFKDLLAAELAIFFHDWIYDPESKTNELDSIAEFDKFADEVALDNLLRRKVIRMIEATIKHQLSENISTGEMSNVKMFLDFDLEVLGRDWNDYEIYAQQIRKEYICYDDAAYRSGRVKVLRAFLNRERIYFSDVYYKDKEQIARTNVAREIALLEAGDVLE